MACEMACLYCHTAKPALMKSFILLSDESGQSIADGLSRKVALKISGLEVMGKVRQPPLRFGVFGYCFYSMTIRKTNSCPAEYQNKGSVSKKRT